MKNTLYAVVAACTAMLATSGIVALATAAPPPRPVLTAELVDTDAELIAHLDGLIQIQLGQIKQRLGVSAN